MRAASTLGSMKVLMVKLRWRGGEKLSRGFTALDLNFDGSVFMLILGRTATSHQTLPFHDKEIITVYRENDTKDATVRDRLPSV
jgi:hypothetical protein